MSAFLFSLSEGQPNVGPNVPQRFVATFPGEHRAAFDQMRKWVGQTKIFPEGTQYVIRPLDTKVFGWFSTANPESYGIFAMRPLVNFQQSATGVQGGINPGNPVGNRGQDRAATAPNQFGYEKLPDSALGVTGDSMFGPAEDGTYNDIINGPDGPVEIKRASF